MNTTKTIGVTGATGRLGRAWIDRALNDDPELRILALVRPSVAASPSQWLSSFRPTHRTRIECVAADFSALWFSAEKLEQLAAVDTGWWHFAAVTHLGAAPDAERLAMAVNVRGTEQLLAAVRATTPETPFYHVSTAYVAGCRRGTITEVAPDSRERFHNPYERSKALGESHVLRFFDSGGRGAIFRPSLVLDMSASGSGDQMPDLCANAVAAAIRRGEPEFHLRVSPGARLHLVSLSFVVRAFAAIAAHAVALPRIYHLTPAREMRFAELQAAIEAAAPLTVKFVPDARRDMLPDASRAFDRMLDDVRAYFSDDLVFDRTNTEALLPPAIADDTCDLPELVARRLAHEFSDTSGIRDELPANV